MRITLTTLSLLLVLFTAKNSNLQAQVNPADINLFLETDLEIDSVFISNISQDREFQFIPYADTLRITLNDSINDLYNIHFFGKKGRSTNQLWLNGQNIVIKGRIAKKLIIDTIIGSALYYKSIEFRKNYAQLLEGDPDSTVIDDFLTNGLLENVGNPYSIEIANNFFYRNISNKNKLKRIYHILKFQVDAIKYHMINPFDQIEKILIEDQIDWNQFRFYTMEHEIFEIHPAKDENILIDYWFMACPPCIRDHKLMIEKVEWLQDLNVQLIGISIDDNHEEWKEFVAEKGYRWLNLREVDDEQLSLRADMLISSFPTYLLVSGDGKILHRTNSFKAMEKYLHN